MTGKESQNAGSQAARPGVPPDPGHPQAARPGVPPDPGHPQKQRLTLSAKVAFGGLAGMVATTVVHPLDVIKVRLQIFPIGLKTLEVARHTVRGQGALALYAGLSAGLMRQATNTTTRVGVYSWLHDSYHSHYSKKPSHREQVLMGVVAGLAGSFAGNPSEVALVRMMADGPPLLCCPRRNPKKYRGAFHAFYKIWREEGVCALWRGGILTLSRSVFVSIAQLGTYAKAREMIRDRRVVDGFALHVYTSLVTSFLTAVLTLPIDLVKTRYQVRRGGVTQREIYADIMRHKGILYFWKGFVPYYIRMAIHTITSFMVLEQLNNMYFTFKDNNKT